MTSATRYPASPYRPSGHFTIAGLLLVLAVSVVGGALVGFLGGLLSEYFYLVLLFPAAFGAACGMLAAAATTRARLQSSRLAAACAALGALSIMPIVHGYGYAGFDQTLAAIGHERLAEAGRVSPDELRAAGIDPDAARAARVTSVAGYIDLLAHRGVVISRHGGAGGIRVGYVGSYVYWGFEILLAAVAAALFAARAASAPACARCRSWMTQRRFGNLRLSAATAVEAIASGELERLRGDDAGAGPGGALTITLSSCARCGADSSATVRLERVPLGRDGKPRAAAKTLAHASYPGAAIVALESVFAGDGTPRVALDAAG